MEKIDFELYDNAIITLAKKIKDSGKHYTCLYPIPRGGYYPAIKISQLLNIPVASKLNTEFDTLIVDDIVDSGKTLEAYPDYDKAVVYAKDYAKDKVQYYGDIKDEWLLIPDEKDCGIEDHIRRMIEYIGEDPTRQGLSGTPDRIVRMWKEIFRGYDPSQKPKITTFPNDDKISDIVFDSGDYYSMCEHHILPFFGKYYFAYIPNPNGRILGISKVARIVGYCAARLQLQERLAHDVVNMLSDALNNDALGFAIAMKGTHLCKSMRGVRNNGKMSVAHFTGVFNFNPELRREFYKLIDMQDG